MYSRDISLHTLPVAKVSASHRNTPVPNPLFLAAALLLINTAVWRRVLSRPNILSPTAASIRVKTVKWR